MSSTNSVDQSSSGDANSMHQEETTVAKSLRLRHGVLGENNRPIFEEGSDGGGATSLLRSDSSRDNGTEIITPWNIILRRKLNSFLFEKTKEEWIIILFPCYTWLQSYNWKETFINDIIAGITVGIMIVPQSMSYAKIAGLPVEYGLYSSLIPIYTYSIYGTSKQLAVGPVAMISLLLNAGLTRLLQDENYDDNDTYQTKYNTLAIQCSFLVGITYIIMGICQLGTFVTIFLSHAVISGFTTGAAVIIGMSQIKYIVGYNIDKTDRIQDVLYYLIININEFNIKTFVMGISFCLLLVGCKNISKKYKKLKLLGAAGPLVVTVIAISTTVLFDLKNYGIPVVGEIPKGLPNITIRDWIPTKEFTNIWGIVFPIVIIGFMESIAISKTLASKNKYDIDPSKELIGLGMANLLGGAFNSYPITGSFSRSAVNNDTNAQSQLSGTITATLVCFALFVLTSIFEQLPLNALAAIVISGVIGLLDCNEVIHLYHIDKTDCIIWVIACFGTMFIGVEIGLLLAVIVSLLVIVYQIAYPQITILGRLPSSTTQNNNYYCDISRYPQAEMVHPNIIIIRIDAPLCFANAQYLKETITGHNTLSERSVGQQQYRFLILEMTSVPNIDSSALQQLDVIIEILRTRYIELVMCNISINALERLQVSGLIEKIGTKYFFPSLIDAVDFCITEIETLREGSTL